MSYTPFFTTDGKLDDASKADVEAMLQRLSRADNPKLMLFVHGGLVNTMAGWMSASEFAGRMAPLQREGWEIGSPIWRSGLGETIRINQDELAQESLFVRIVVRLIEWLDRKLGLGVVDRAFIDNGDVNAAITALNAAPQPEAEAVEVRLGSSEGELERAQNVEALSDQHLENTDLAQMLLDDSEFVAAVIPGLSMIDADVRERVDAARVFGMARSRHPVGVSAPAAYAVSLSVVRAGYRVLKRLVQDRDHGLGPTIVEEVIGALYLDQVGSAAWKLMKDDARQHFDAGGAGRLVFRTLAEIARTGKPVRLITVGHSAGSVFAAAQADYAAEAPANLTMDNIFLAPAVRIDEASEKLGSGRADGLRIFTMDDAHERANHLDGTIFGKIYQRSLLYLISGVLERGTRSRYTDAPLVGLQRHLIPKYRPTREERRELDAFKGWLGAKNDGLIYSPSPTENGPGRRAFASVHGGFWRDDAVVESILWIARNGFNG